MYGDETDVIMYGNWSGNVIFASDDSILPKNFPFEIHSFIYTEIIFHHSADKN